MAGRLVGLPYKKSFDTRNIGVNCFGLVKNYLAGTGLSLDGAKFFLLPEYQGCYRQVKLFAGSFGLSQTETAADKESKEESNWLKLTEIISLPEPQPSDILLFSFCGKDEINLLGICQGNRFLYVSIQAGVVSAILSAAWRSWMKGIVRCHRE